MNTTRNNKIITCISSIIATALLTARLYAGAGENVWQEELRDHPSSSGDLVAGLILLAVVGAVIAWLRRRSENMAGMLLCATVVGLSIWAAWREHSLLLVPFALIGFGFGAWIFWVASEFFVRER